jgi:hypothetical protein
VAREREREREREGRERRGRGAVIGRGESEWDGHLAEGTREFARLAV